MNPSSASQLTLSSTSNPHPPTHPAVDYVAMTPEGRVFDSSLQKGAMRMGERMA